MTSIDPRNTSHPEDLLEAYSLAALEDSEALQIEAHVDNCPQCQQSVAGFLQVASVLANTVDQQAPPAHLRARIMDSLPSRTLPPAVAAPLAVATSSILANRFSRLLLPLASVVMIGLFVTTVMMNRQISTRVDQLEQENSTVNVRLNHLDQENSLVSARLNQAVADESQMVNTINQIRAANYLMADPSTQPLLLKPPNPQDGAHGVLLVRDGGRSAILMVTDMKQPSPPSSYQVWAARKGHRVLLGEMTIDSAGWGTMNLTPPEPLFQYEWVNMTEEDFPPRDAPMGEMVLRSKIPSASDNR